MSDEYSQWLRYADENLEIARLALEHKYYNACLQNVQQAVEKYLKATLLYNKSRFPKTHNIEMLRQQLADLGIEISISDEEAELLDTIYVPSKYPLGNALPDFVPDSKIGEQCLDIADRGKTKISQVIENN